VLGVFGVSVAFVPGLAAVVVPGVVGFVPGLAAGVVPGFLVVVVVVVGDVREFPVVFLPSVLVVVLPSPGFFFGW